MTNPTLGLLYPTRDCGEDDFTRLAALVDPALAVEFAYVPWSPSIGRVEELDTAGKRAAVRELGEPNRLTRAAGDFAGTPAVVSWACSSCSFLDGVDGARAQARAVSERLGVPASSTSLAYLSAVAHLGLRRVALGSVYSEDVTEAFAGFLAEAGVETVHSVSLDAPSDRALATWDRTAILDLVRQAGHPRADAVLVPETALHTTGLLPELERIAGKPVLTATQVTVWDALGLIGRPRAVSGLGRLFG